MLADDGAEHPETSTGTQPSAAHLQRLERLLEQQADQLEAAEAGWRELAIFGLQIDRSRAPSGLA